MSLLDIVDKDTLLDIEDSYMGYLGSSGGIYDISGEYITLQAASGYCEFLNNASRKLCGDVKNDKAAMSSGKWICYEHCCSVNLECISSKKPKERECPGGMVMYTVPITTNRMVIGSISAGVSNPPLDHNRIRQIAEQYHLDQGQLADMAAKHEFRPDSLFQAARRHILTSSRIIAVIYEKNLYQKTFTERIERLKEANAKLVLAQIDAKDLSDALEMQVKERTSDIEAKNNELENMLKSFLGREIRMVELKNEINKLTHEIEDLRGKLKEGDKNEKT
jgi:hypothetical protein